MSQFNSKIVTTHIVINNHLHKNINRYSPSLSHTITIIHQIQIIINLYAYGLSPKTYMNVVPHLLIVLPELYYWTLLNIVARDMLLYFSQHGCQRCYWTFLPHMQECSSLYMNSSSTSITRIPIVTYSTYECKTPPKMHDYNASTQIIINRLTINTLIVILIIIII